MNPDELYALITKDCRYVDSSWRVEKNVENWNKIEAEVLFSDKCSPNLKLLATAFIQAFHYNEAFKSKYNLYIWNEALSTKIISVISVVEAYRLILAQIQTNNTRWLKYKELYKDPYRRGHLEFFDYERKAENLAVASKILLAYIKAYCNYSKEYGEITLNRNTIGLYEDKNPSKVFCRKLESVLKISPGKCSLDGNSIDFSSHNDRRYASVLTELGLNVECYSVHAFSFWRAGLRLKNDLTDAIEILSKRQAEMFYIPPVSHPKKLLSAII